jgi:hypothetical protein
MVPDTQLYSADVLKNFFDQFCEMSLIGVIAQGYRGYDTSHAAGCFSRLTLSYAQEVL